MDIFRYNSWREFRRDLLVAIEHSLDTGQLWFRGQANVNWPLTASLDRAQTFEDDSHRANFFARLLKDFRRELMYVGEGKMSELQGEALELFGRHNGLPSPILDWSTSPYIASYFAYADDLANETDPVAIWCLDKTRFEIGDDLIKLIDDPELVRYNRPALQQRAVFMRISSIVQSVEELLAEALIKFEVRGIDRRFALADLDNMTINATYLFWRFFGSRQIRHVARTLRELSNDRKFQVGASPLVA